MGKESPKAKMTFTVNFTASQMWQKCYVLAVETYYSPEGRLSIIPVLKDTEFMNCEHAF